MLFRFQKKQNWYRKLLNAETKQKVDESSRGYLGIYGRDVSTTISNSYDVPEGVYIYQVIKGSGADNSGLIDKRCNY